MSTGDNKKYTIRLNKENRLSSSDRICVYVSGLTGTGTGKVETYYSDGSIIRHIMKPEQLSRMRM